MVVISLTGCAASLNISRSEGYVEDGTYAANERLTENERYGGIGSTEGPGLGANERCLGTGNRTDSDYRSDREGFVSDDITSRH